MSFIQLNQNDDLTVVVRKCNANFRSVASQQQQQEVTGRQASEATEEQIAEQIGEAVDSLVYLVNQEASARSQADLDLENAIETLAQTANQIATTTTLGIVKIGSGLAVAPDGTLSLDIASLDGTRF